MRALRPRPEHAVAAAFALLAVGATAETVPGKRYVVAAIGDSLTDFKVHGGAYLKMLGEKCPGSTFDSYGKGGQMVNQMRKRFVGQVFAADKPRYTHVIVMGGVNDLISDETANRTVAKIEADLSFMYTESRKRKARVVAVTVAPWAGFTKFWTEHRGETTKQLNDWIRSKKGDGVDVVDASAVLAGDDKSFLCEGCGMKDGLHWTKKGHEKIADEMFRTLFSDCRDKDDT